MVKLSPNVTSIVAVAERVEQAGADSLSLINTVTAMVIDTQKRKPMIANGIGGLSGPAIRPIAVRMIAEVYPKVKIPLVGIGGIMDLNDALEFFIAGARAVQVGTATFINPKAAVNLVDDLKNYVLKNNLKSIEEIVGTLKWG
jgi:dihydroorotate dehydrogenase (NAD+) catalytic subunit